MTDEELDIFLIDTLKKVLSDMQECKNYVKDLHTPEYDEINTDYDQQIDMLTSLVKNIKGIDDLSEKDEETITAVYDFIASYADNFLIHPDAPEQEKDWEEYDKLEEILDLFMDTEDEE